MIDVEENAIDLRVMLLDKFENELKDGLLTVLVAESDTCFRTRFLKKLVMAASGWVVCSQPELWSHPGTLQCQIAQIMKTQAINSIGTDLKVWSQNYLLTEQGWDDFVANGSVFA